MLHIIIKIYKDFYTKEPELQDLCVFREVRLHLLNIIDVTCNLQNCKSFCVSSCHMYHMASKDNSTKYLKAVIFNNVVYLVLTQHQYIINST